MRVVKTCQDANAQVKWFDSVRDGYKPKDIVSQLPNQYSYKFVIGHAPRDPMAVWLDAGYAIWDGVETLPMDRRAYIDYVESIEPHDCFDLIDTKRLTPVHNCHGDLTLYNCIEQPHDSKIIFLDPGNCRGLPCKELDEAKILQSCDGFDTVHM